MQGLAAVTAPAAEDGRDLLPCPDCGTPLAAPHATDYRGLGRIEHSWRCHGCGKEFRTRARMAGAVECEPENAAAA